MSGRVLALRLKVFFLTVIGVFASVLLAQPVRAHGRVQGRADGCDRAPLTLESPQGTNRFLFCLKQGSLAYAVETRGHPLIEWSALGFELDGAPPLAGGFEIASVECVQRDQTWEQPWGEDRFVRDRHHELSVRVRERAGLRREQTLRFRAFEDGVAFRYEIDAQPGLESLAIRAEKTEFRFGADGARGDAWSIPAYRSEAYELLDSKSKVSSLPRHSHTPLTMRLARVYVSLHEAALVDYSSMQIENAGPGILRAHLAPAVDGMAVRVRTPMRTPWRTIQIAPSAAALLDSRMILNLNEPNRLGDVSSYAKPQKFIGIWWGMHLGRYTWRPGPKHGATTERAKRYMDAASELGMAGVLVEGWNVGWENWSFNPLRIFGSALSGGVGAGFDFVTPTADFDLREVARYGHERGVELIGHHETAGAVDNYERQMESAYALYRDVGVKNVKSGYVADKIAGEFHYGQRMVRHYQHAVERAAAYGISLNVHEPVKDTGLRRTYPNLMTREGLRGAEYDAWGGGNPPKHTVTLPFTRGLSGPMDYTPGVFDLLTGSRPGVDRFRGTLAKQLALFVLLYSPLQMAADLPENYRGHPAFQFLRDAPVDWAESRGLAGEIGEYAVIARRDRASRDWYMSAATDESPRETRISLGFLEAGTTYCATAYRDGPRAHWETNPYAYEIAEYRVQQEDEIALKLAPGGGQAIRLVPCTGR